MAADQFCLRWNNFQLNIASALDSLKTDEDLVDVTLSCEGQNVKAHKVVLSACSPYFRGVFKENPCQHPIVILKDVSYEDVSALLSFMYQGEVYITQDRLASFLHTAELLQVRGLTGASSPFKDSPKQCKTKKAMLTSSGQLRQDTPPLSSPPAVALPLQPSNKTTSVHPISKSPLVTLKELHSSFSLVQTKPAAVNSSTAVHQHSSTAMQPSSYQHSTPTQYRNPPPLEHSPTYQQSSSNQQLTCPQHQTVSGESSQQETDQPNHQSSSPQPPSAKRRKAFPRRVSIGGHLPNEESVESPDADKMKTKSNEEQIGCEIVSLGAAPVKQEPEDEVVFEVDATMEEESNPIAFDNADEDVIQMESPGSDVVRRLDYFGNVETIVAEEPVPVGQDVIKEEAVAEGGPPLVPHSMLLRSLSGAKQPTVVGDSSPSRVGDGAATTRTTDEADGGSFKGPSNMEEIFGIPSWTTNKTHDASDLFVLSESLNIVNRRLTCKQRSNSVDERPVLGSTSQGLEVQPAYNVAGRSRYAASSLTKHSLYQQRKHSWRDRKSVV